MDKYTSWFGYQSEHQTDCNAFDLCILDELKREKKARDEAEEKEEEEEEKEEVTFFSALKSISQTRREFYGYDDDELLIGADE